MDGVLLQSNDFWSTNVGATYLRSTITLFHDRIHKEIEVCMDDVAIKYKRCLDHFGDLRKFFEKLRK